MNEAAISAMILLIVDLPSGEGLTPDRFYEALVGCGVAIAVNALLPFNPERMVEKAARPLFDEAVAVLKTWPRRSTAATRTARRARS